MKKNLKIIVLATFVTACQNQKAIQPAEEISRLPYPATEKGEVTDNYFGTEVPDPYRWLEDDTAPATENWIAEQNKVTNAYLEQIQRQCGQIHSAIYNAYVSYPADAALTAS